MVVEKVVAQVEQTAPGMSCSIYAKGLVVTMEETRAEARVVVARAEARVVVARAVAMEALAAVMEAATTNPSFARSLAPLAQPRHQCTCRVAQAAHNG